MSVGYLSNERWERRRMRPRLSYSTTLSVEARVWTFLDGEALSDHQNTAALHSMVLAIREATGRHVQLVSGVFGPLIIASGPRRRLPDSMGGAA